MAFKQRGLNLAQARVSKLVCKGLPTSKQLAYCGYKENIEAFLSATATGQRVLTSGDVYTLPDTYTPTVPLALPQLVVRLAKVQTPEVLKVFEEGLAPFGAQRVAVGKGPISYTIDRPSFKIIHSVLHTVCSQEAPFLDNRAQLVAARALLPVYRAIDLFLATNTYEYKPLPENLLEYTEDGKKGYRTLGMQESVSGVGHIAEIRTGTVYWTEGCSSKGPAIKKQRVSDTKGKAKFLETEEAYLTPWLNNRCQAEETVFVAKPSPLPSSTNWGPPANVPVAKGGLVFPYFQGMMAADTTGLRELISNLFLRNLGSNKETPKEAFLQLRKVIGTAANTPQGVILGHVLYGIKLALDTQSVLYLLFDNKVYLGFCLLGREFSVLLHGEWHKAKEPKELEADLLTMKTHDQTLKDLAARIMRCRLSDAGGMSVDIELKTSRDVARALARIEPPKDDNDKDHINDEAEVSEILSRLNFPTAYQTFKPDNIARAIRYLLGQEQIPEDIHFWIPLKSWKSIDSDEYAVLAQFGPRSFSLRNAKGDEIPIPKDATEVDPFAEMESEKAKIPKYLIGEKPIAQALVDWAALVETGKLRMDFKERAAGARNHVMPRDQFKPIWEALKKGVVDGKLRVKGEKASKKRKPDVAFGEGTISADLFA